MRLHWQDCQESFEHVQEYLKLVVYCWRNAGVRFWTLMPCNAPSKGVSPGPPALVENKKRNKTMLSQNAPLFRPMGPFGVIQPSASTLMVGSWTICPTRLACLIPDWISGRRG